MGEQQGPHPEMEGWSSCFIAAPDGLPLHVAQTGNPLSPRVPVLCLPGLTRNTLDFEVIGNRIARAQGRRVLALDYRGRGLSAHDPDWKRYDLMVELDDLMAVLTALGIQQAIFLGTSRGGLLTMLTAIARPQAIRAAILNDIGAVIEPQGLARIRSYVGKIPEPSSYEQGVHALKLIFGAQFPDESDASWLAFARRIWREENGAREHVAQQRDPVLQNSMRPDKEVEHGFASTETKAVLLPRYDRRLMNTLTNLDLEKPIPPLWPQFDALKFAPLLVIRGENSDLFSQATAEAMVARHPQGDFNQPARLHIAARQGHAPLLEDEPTIGAILEFLDAADPA